MSNHTRLDSFGRQCRYLRLSVTDRCNLGCRYCVSCARQHFIPHEKILRYEEFQRLVQIGQGLGIKKLRITGGEPFCRLGLMQFISSLRKNFPTLELAITTNATLIAPLLTEIAQTGFSSINISLDTFDRATFQSITGKDFFNTVMNNVDGLLALGQRVKINAVAMRGITDIQIGDFIHAVMNLPIDLRFIEYMPMGSNTLWDQSEFLSCLELRQLISSHLRLEEAPVGGAAAGPARIYAVSGAKGRFGFISAVSDHFCRTCNRLRITSDGRLRTCLFSDRELRLAPLLRHSNIQDRHISHVIAHALRTKPLGSDILTARSRIAVASGQMVGIGG